VPLSDPIVETLILLQQCCSLRRLELWFPDPQRFALGYVLSKEDRMFLRLLWPLEGLSELIIHGIDELGIIEVNLERMKIPRVIAELNCSRARPFLHIEAGRPNLRANPNWQVCQSNRYTINLELQKAKTVSKDMFSELPTEIRALIYNYLFSCWYEEFHGASRFEEENKHHPYIMLKNLSYDCQRPKARRRVLTGAAALLGVSKLLHEEAAAIFGIHSVQRRLSAPATHVVAGKPIMDTASTLILAYSSTSFGMLVQIIEQDCGICTWVCTLSSLSVHLPRSSSPQI